METEFTHLAFFTFHHFYHIDIYTHWKKWQKQFTIVPGDSVRSGDPIESALDFIGIQPLMDFLGYLKLRTVR